MDRTIDKGIVEAAKYFKEEVLEIMPGIPRDELSAMVGEYVYYHQANVGKDQMRKAVEATCARK